MKIVALPKVLLAIILSPNFPCAIPSAFISESRSNVTEVL